MLRVGEGNLSWGSGAMRNGGLKNFARVSAYVREALERHNTSMSVASVLENSNAHLEQLIDELREENALFRSALQEDLRRLRDETKAEQDSAIQRYEEALRKVVTAALSQPSPKGSGAAKVPAAGPMTAPRT